MAREIYRTLDGTGVGEEHLIYYFLTKISDNTTLIFSDNIIDAALGDRIIEDNDTPPAGLQGFVEYNGFLYGYIPESHDLRYSKINAAEGWSPFAVEPIAPGSGGTITALGTLNALVVFKEKSIHNWIGFPGLFRRTRKASGLGCVGQETVQNVDLPSGGDVLFFLSQWGPYFFDEQDPYPVGREISPIFDGSDSLYLFNHAQGKKAQATYIFDEKKYFLSIPVNGASENNLLLIYDVYAKSWHLREPFFAGSITTRTNSADRQVPVGGESRNDATDGGFTFTIEGNDQYLGGDYKGEYITSWNHLGYPNQKKLGLTLELDAETAGVNPLFVDFYVDGDERAVLTRSVILDSGGTLWDSDTDLWDGDAKWDQDQFLSPIIGLMRMNFRQIALGFRTELKDAPWHILQARLVYKLLPSAGTRL